MGGNDTCRAAGELKKGAPSQPPSCGTGQHGELLSGGTTGGLLAIAGLAAAELRAALMAVAQPKPKSMLARLRGRMGGHVVQEGLHREAVCVGTWAQKGAPVPHAEAEAENAAGGKGGASA